VRIFVNYKIVMDLWLTAVTNFG